MIRIILGDITEIDDVDVIVNSARKSLMGGSGVDGAIHSKAGNEELSKACKELNGCNTGEAKITKGFKLKVPYIIHTVGPIYNEENLSKDDDYNQADLLKNSYLNSLNLAKEFNLKRIAFSAISTGVYGYPIDEATKIALDTIIEFLNYNQEFNITVVLYTEELYIEYINQIKNYGLDYIKERRNTNTVSLKDIKMKYNQIFNEGFIEDVEPVLKNKKESFFNKFKNKFIK